MDLRLTGLNEETPLELYHIKGREVWVKRDDLMGDGIILPLLRLVPEALEDLPLGLSGPLGRSIPGLISPNLSQIALFQARPIGRAFCWQPGLGLDPGQSLPLADG